MSTPLIAGNWKMNTTVGEASTLATAVKNAVAGVSGVDVVLCPPFVSLAEVRRAVEGSLIQVGAQNMHYEDKGAFTGEISPAMLQGLCNYVILGHSERRRDFAESNELVNRKARKALESGLKPIICVGEVLEERQQGREESVVSTSVVGCLEGIDSPDNLVIAYEPVWAIGTGLSATSDQAQAMAALIRRLLTDRFGPEGAASVPVLYGGSVNPDNVAELAAQPDIDGALVGGASLNAGHFADIVRITARVRTFAQ